ncbi:hypothetical protein GIB67_016910 [Kingdonia uniflora]|uniref:Single-stranded nucleic acid binding R3H protein n=1 Tax=Kingdonia uniflora TaxID=39325 RepID=A0A7J7M3E3_9MAGN|nr:hypothetical protein GIB67_016910 [Kingdonia uniflora]
MAEAHLLSSPLVVNDGVVVCEEEREIQGGLVLDLDPALKDALLSPRWRLIVLRLELDIQRFMQTPDQQKIEFLNVTNQYNRLIIHRAAQHYGLHSEVVGNAADGPILVTKTAESRYPEVCLSEVPFEEPGNEKPEQFKIAIRQRPHNGSSDNGNEVGTKRSPVRTVEERKEEYDRARARIFKDSEYPESEESFSQDGNDGRSFHLSRDDSEVLRNNINMTERIPITREASNYSRIAILKDREKDRSDPDYDRSYDRYVRGLPRNQSLGLVPLNIQGFRPSFVQYEPGFPQLSPLPRAQHHPSYGPPHSPVMSPYCAVGISQTSGDPVYMQWASPGMMYANSYRQFRHSVFQAPFNHQPLSFDYSQNH